METLYRKVKVKERTPNNTGHYYSNIGLVFFGVTHGKFQHYLKSEEVYPVWWFEKIDSSEIQKLQSDKAELLEALVKCNKFLYDFKQKNIEDAYKLQSETIFLIQKHNQKY